MLNPPDIYAMPLQNGGGIVMAAIWGKIRYNKQQGAYCIEGKWQGKRVYFSAYRDELGRLKTCQTEDEIRTLQHILSNEIKQGSFNPKRYQKSRPLHVEKYADQWLRSIRVSYSTLKSYRAALKYVKHGFGHIFLPDLNHSHIKDWVNNMVILPSKYVPKAKWGQPVGMKTRKNYHGVLAEMLLDAKRAGHITQMPELVKFTHSLKVPKKLPEWLSQSEQDSVLQEIPPADRYIFRFLFLTGVRVSEGRAFAKYNMFPNRMPPYITITETYAPVKGGEKLKEVKQKSERQLLMSEPLVQLFKEMPIYIHTDRVFVASKTGRPYTKNINRDIWNPACLKALGRIVKLNNAGRHSFANQQLASGEDIYRVSKRLGHSSVKTTQDNYIDGGMVV